MFEHLRKNPLALASAKNSTYVLIEARMRLEVQGGESSKRQTRREAGTQSYGLLTVLRGGRIRLPGYRRDGRDPEYAWWTGLPKGSPVFLRARQAGQWLVAGGRWLVVSD
jgi:hypothetical protein